MRVFCVYMPYTPIFRLFSYRLLHIYYFYVSLFIHSFPFSVAGCGNFFAALETPRIICKKGRVTRPKAYRFSLVFLRCGKPQLRFEQVAINGDTEVPAL